MRALVLEDFHRLVVADRPDPVAGPHDVVLDVAFTGICGSDLHGYTGVSGRREPGQVMGHESVGRIRSVGGEVTGLHTGQVVTFNPVVAPPTPAWAGREHLHPGKYVLGVRPDIDAAFAEQVLVPARNVVPLPDGMPIEHGALIEPVAVAVHAVRRAGARDARNTLVVGGGPIGQAVVLALRHAGVDPVLVSETEAARRELVEQLGAVAIDPLDAATGPLAERVEARFGRLADVTIDAVGVDASLADALIATRVGGVVCLVGLGQPRVSLDAFEITTTERSLVGSFTYSVDDFREAVRLVAQETTASSTLISRVVPLDEAPAAFASLAAGDGTPGKVLVALS
ncbi:zinc-binding dehydrogenase [Kineosporia sp. NBRC 101731]|uniref:zinc-dependent alcohol dehydrogenase n=1 Tax=Kineosporia sp. NBRC 101731 TaxID=3032199 RepID=UPI0024A32320|nr:zinc-binding dehydrogenase [Kineosporia sp. NBRC 101731]GLY28758.1 Zn-dependent alcohol dehydrogenase [Kineosporia sp. NBRC 101731]